MKDSQRGIAAVLLVIATVLIIGAVVAVAGLRSSDEPAPESANDTNQSQDVQLSDTTNHQTAEEPADQPASSTPSGSSSGSTGGGTNGNETPAPPANKTVTVTYTTSFTSPVTINVGDSVKFVNSSDRDIQPASNNHPSHDIYPGFESPSDIPPGGSWSFTFTKLGTWGYHDHNSSAKTGTIIVQ